MSVILYETITKLHHLHYFIVFVFTKIVFKLKHLHSDTEIQLMVLLMYTLYFFKILTLNHTDRFM